MRFLANLLRRLRSNPVAAAGRGLERAQAEYEAAREAVLARANRESKRSAALKQRALRHANCAAMDIEEAQRAERVAGRIREILS